MPGLDVTKRRLYRVGEMLLLDPPPPPGDTAAAGGGGGDGRGDGGMPLLCCFADGDGGYCRAPGGGSLMVYLYFVSIAAMHANLFIDG